MAIAVSPLLLPAPALPPPRLTALRPVAAGDAGARAGTGAQTDAEALREDELFRLRADPAEGQSSGGSPDHGSRAGRAGDEEGDDHQERETPALPGGTAAFMVQLFGADDPEEAPQDPFGDATRAYGRFREERHAGMIIDVRDPVYLEA